MEIFLNIMLLILGMVLLIKGADFFVDGSSSIARLLKIPSLIIGLTLVSIGTSAPELSVSITSSIAHQNDLSFGNVIGSNIFNVLMVIGISSIIAPLAISKDIKKIDIPVLLFIYAILILFGFIISPNVLELFESIIILCLFVMYMVFLIVRSLKAKVEEEENEEESNTSLFSKLLPLIFILLGVVTFIINMFNIGDVTSLVLTYTSFFLICLLMFVSLKLKGKELSKPSLWIKNIIYAVIGIFGVVMGGNVVVDSASFIASSLGMSEVLIGLTIVAIGTSLPELVTSIIAAKKGENDIALGNAIGSCLFNVILILGLSSAISPIVFDSSYIVDVIVMTLSVVYVLIISFKAKELKKVHGLIMVVAYLGYTTYIVARNYIK